MPGWAWVIVGIAGGVLVCAGGVIAFACWLEIRTAYPDAAKPPAGGLVKRGVARLRRVVRD